MSDASDASTATLPTPAHAAAVGRSPEGSKLSHAQVRPARVWARVKPRSTGRGVRETDTHTHTHRHTHTHTDRKRMGKDVVCRDKKQH